jgi:hypothetical protein
MHVLRSVSFDGDQIGDASLLRHVSFDGDLVSPLFSHIRDAHCYHISLSSRSDNTHSLSLEGHSLSPLRRSFALSPKKYPTTYPIHRRQLRTLWGSRSLTSESWRCNRSATCLRAKGDSGRQPQRPPKQMPPSSPSGSAPSSASSSRPRRYVWSSSGALASSRWKFPPLLNFFNCFNLILSVFGDELCSFDVWKL